jgi:hypothetical protein
MLGVPFGPRYRLRAKITPAVPRRIRQLWTIEARFVIRHVWRPCTTLTGVFEIEKLRSVTVTVAADAPRRHPGRAAPRRAVKPPRLAAV